MNRKTILVIDCVYDFIDGSLACLNAEEAVQYIIRYINNHPTDQVIYIREVHPSNHCSFKDQGGIWPSHAVEGTRGSQLHQDFFSKIEVSTNRPNESNTFIKGQNPQLEQYSGYEGITKQGQTLSQALTQDITVMGIATEYCVLNTLNDLANQGLSIKVLEQGLGYVTLEGHKQTIKELINRNLV